MANTSLSGPITKALAVLIRPLVRLLLQHGVTYPTFIQLVRRVYVDVAATEFQLPGGKQTDSRLSLLTGIHRRYVKEIRAQLDTPFSMPTNVSLGGQLVATWLSDPRFLDSDGNARALKRLAGDKESEFEALVRTVTTDLRPRALLDELSRLGVVRVDDEDLVILERGAFVPKGGSDEKLYFFARNLHDHIAAGVHNIEDGQPPFMERSAYNSALTAASARTLAEHAEHEGMRALRSFHAKAEQLRAQDKGEPAAQYRVNFGAYFYSTRETDPEHDGD